MRSASLKSPTATSAFSTCLVSLPIPPAAPGSMFPSRTATCRAERYPLTARMAPGSWSQAGIERISKQRLDASPRLSHRTKERFRRRRVHPPRFRTVLNRFTIRRGSSLTRIMAADSCILQRAYAASRSQSRGRLASTLRSRIIDGEVRRAILHERADVAHLRSRQQIQHRVQDRGLLRYVPHGLGVAFRRASGSALAARRARRRRGASPARCRRRNRQTIAAPPEIRRTRGGRRHG